jgi:arsenate reductase (thioredoxin)
MMVDVIGRRHAERGDRVSTPAANAYLEPRDRIITQLAEESSGVFVPTFVHRVTCECLLAAVRLEGARMSERPEVLPRPVPEVLPRPVPEVLFVCVQNAGRSQMAAALLDHHADGRVLVRSAGSMPAEEIHPPVVEVMDELGLDLTQEFPKPLTDEVVQASDVVITMGCGDACPVYPGKRYLDWELDDPSGRPLDEVRAIRDEIDRRVRELLDELLDQAEVESTSA